MDHVAIDWGGRESQVCICGGDGTILEEVRVLTRELEPYLAKRPPSRVVIESSAASFSLADAAKKFGHEVCVVPATLVKALGVGARRMKTDQRDARALATASCRVDLPCIHIPSMEARSLKALCGMRDPLVRGRTMLINSVRGWLRNQGRTVRASTTTLSIRLRAEDGDKLPLYVERNLAAIDELTRQIREADRQLRETAQADQVCRRLMTIPGVGPLTALRFRAVVDDVSRFPSAHVLESYIGLTPGEHSSSDKQHRLSITKAGSPALRMALIQAAWVAKVFRKEDPMVRWCLEVQKRRGKFVAVVALARKLVGIMYALWRDGSIYDRARGASA